MENKEPKPITVELEDDTLDKVSGAGDETETVSGVPTFHPILIKK